MTIHTSWADNDRVDAGAYLPVALRLDNIQALIIGGGQVAANKLHLLMGRCPHIHIWAEKVGEEISLAAREGRVLLHLGKVTEAHLARHIPHMGIIFAATDDAALNRMVFHIAQKHHVPVCAVDAPAFSSFITPAIIDRTPVQIGISTSGAAPVLARRLREAIEALLPAGLGRAAAFMASYRPWLKNRMPDMTGRKRLWEDFLDGSGYEAALSGNMILAEKTLKALVTQAEEATDQMCGGGEVWLVGAGPGDPDLLTLAALRLMQNADAVLYDHLVSAEILDRVRRDAERICVGKTSGHHLLPQGEIQEEMIRRARAGQRVLRLKGGDPFIFGRGGEEMEALIEAGIPVRVIPGITAANGCGAAAGIPLTHRDCARICVFVTGHRQEDGRLSLDFELLARKGQTLVVYMGIAALSQLCAGLQRHGLPDSWPVAVIERGTCPQQRVITGTLSDIATRVTEAAIKGPGLVIIGEVVYHRRKGDDLEVQDKEQAA